MVRQETVAMILAGGQGTRLGVLTDHVAKPAVPFGSRYRIIDFPLSNCTNSGIEAVGVLTQYQPLELNKYIGNGHSWDLDRNTGVPIFFHLIRACMVATGIKAQPMRSIRILHSSTVLALNMFWYCPAIMSTKWITTK